jgi:uncharacterized C2H2 Zn-finger protein
MKMEVAIFKSIPIIVRQVVLHSCPACQKLFKLNRQLFSHAKKLHQLNLPAQQEFTCDVTVLSKMVERKFSQ